MALARPLADPGDSYPSGRPPTGGRRIRFIAVAVAGAVIALLISPNGPLGGFWAPMDGSPTPHGGLLAGFLAEGIAENVAFGLGIATLVFGRRWFATRTATSNRATTATIASAWLFASWMPHRALHLHLGTDLPPLLAVEWIFHIGSILAIAALLWALSTGPRTKPATP